MSRQVGVEENNKRAPMTYAGHIVNGVVVLDDAVTLPEGTAVKVEPVELPHTEGEESEIPTLYERLKPFIGKVEGLPPDMSVNLDHYLYGLPKRQ
jgi:hypothetical protein